MKLDNIAGCKSINSFVEKKLEIFKSKPHSFESLYTLMFSEKSNVIYEKSNGYKISKTTYGQCEENIKKRAASMYTVLSNYDYNSIVGLYMDNSLEWIECFWSILMCGMRPLLMNRRLDKSILDSTLNELGAVAVITDSVTFSVTTYNYNEILDSESELPVQFGSEILVMSSGTSNNVKVCGYSAEEIYFQIQDSYEIIKKCAQMKKHYNGQLKLLTFLPFYHIFGLVAVYIWFAFFSRTFVHLSDMAPQTIVNTIRRHEVTHIFAVPLFWETVYASAIREIKGRGEKTFAKFNKGLKIASKIGDVPLLGNLFIKKAFKEIRDNLFGESICFLITGGSDIKYEVISFFNYIGYHLADGYGMTEIGITSVELSNNKKTLNSLSVGRPMSSIEYSLNEKGELLVRGGATAKYIIEKGLRKEKDGSWFNTHDLARCGNGAYHILGRSDDLIVTSSGENVNPNLIESKFTVNGVNSVCLVYDKKADGAILLASVNKYLSTEDYERINKELRETLNSLSLSSEIKNIVLVGDSFIKGDEFKLNRSRIAKEYAESLLAVITPDKIRNDIDDELSLRVKTYFAGALDKSVEQVFKDQDFFVDGGGTSLEYFAMCSEMQSEFGYAFNQSEDNKLLTPDDFCNYIRSHSA